MPHSARTPLRLVCIIVPALILRGDAGPGFTQQQDEEAPFRPGLVTTLRDGHGLGVARLDAQLGFDWGAEPPDPRLGPGDFLVRREGYLLSQGRGEYRFALFGTGEIELQVAGKVVVARRVLRGEWYESAPVALGTGRLALKLSFRRTEKPARLTVLWSGPQFGAEPIPGRLLSHVRRGSPGEEFERGRLLAHALRCGHCHAGETPPAPAPALNRLAGNLGRDWLLQWLKGGGHPARKTKVAPRRMPGFWLTAAEAESVADWLLAARAGDVPVPPLPKVGKTPPPTGKKKAPKKARPDARTGERLFLTLGCLACHTWRDLGGGGWFGGGDLTQAADKRPPGYFAAWLADPARLNRDHRMPVFALADDERTSLALFLAEQKAKDGRPKFSASGPAPKHALGRKLVEWLRCAACHRLPEAQPGEPAIARPRAAPLLGPRSDWAASCLRPPSMGGRPGYRLSEADARSVQLYYTTRHPENRGRPTTADGRLLLAELNCLACHARESAATDFPLRPPLLADGLTALAKRHTDLAPLMPALMPPALNSVGDKLNDPALADAIARRGEPHRPYLQVRMPRFRLRDDELQALVHHLVAADRVPPQAPGTARTVVPPQPDRYALAGGRLVSGDGFGCTSCHQVGAVAPPPGPINTRGPDLSQLGRRIRKEWFDRFVRNPARILPNMEMPSVQIPVSGVLDDKLDPQLAAVWHVLNLPGFEPPAPNPLRTLRHDGNHPGAAPLLVTDILHRGSSSLLKPFLVGLANRHNVLLDLEAGGLALWTVGDTARQRTKGKHWFWELAGTPVLDTGISAPDLTLVSAAGVELAAQLQGQFVTEADSWQSDGSGLALQYRLSFPATNGKSAALHVRRALTPLAAAKGGRASGFAQELTATPLPPGARLRLRVLTPEAAKTATLTADGRAILLKDRFASRIVLHDPPSARFAADGSLTLPATAKEHARVVLHYLSEAPIDRFPELPQEPIVAGKGEPVEVAPGFVGTKLPLPATIMPTGLTWRPNGRLVFSCLRGQVLEAVDTNGDGLEDRLVLLADGLPSPYGARAEKEYVDVSVKYGLLRIAGGRVEVIASGWGYSRDYHDWAVGLPRNERGEYFLGIPCEQDKRSAAAAKYHGTVLRLVPRMPTSDNPRRFTLEPISAGHRFPMGLAFDRGGELFVTDNQGNYNPFNELNHVRRGAHFGFINSRERGKPAPPLTPPAIDIPHPWTRSVNGICFLYTPRGRGAKLFGPLEGHLIGCEYDTRRLIRMTLQKVGDTFQGAAYPLSIPPQDPAHGFLGPLVCEVSPKGDLYVGSVRDSGWGAGNNIGEVVRVRIEPERLPCGIAEVRAVADGFTIDFLKPVDRALAGQAASYAVESYRREVTPAYGGPDRDRRTEKVTAVVVSPDARRVTLRLRELRAGFVYEFRLRNLAPGGAEFHPAEAFYTLRVRPRGG